jgi:uncharacterized protein
MGYLAVLIVASLRRHIRVRFVDRAADTIRARDMRRLFRRCVGIMMMAVWSLLGRVTLKAVDPAKALLVATANAIAVLCFIVAGAV